MAKSAEDESKFQIVDAIISMLSHDLRNPLHLIQLNASLLEHHASSLEHSSSRAPEKIREQVAGIHRAVRSMTRMITTLLDASSINSGKLPITKTQVDAAEDVLEAVEEFLPVAEGRNLKITVEMPDRPLWVLYDQYRIRQVLGNLIANAIKYADPESTIHIIAQRHPDDPLQIRFQVRSKGNIIPPEMRKIIFERFAHLQRSKSTIDPESIGLGLWIADWIITEHDGTIWVEETKLNDGNNFCFVMPRNVPDNLL